MTPRVVPEHSYGAYSRGRCRCDECREYARVYRAMWRASLPLLPEGDERHGLDGYGNYGCRCSVCKSAKRDARRLQKKR